MPTFVYMTRCDGCGHCVDICPSDIMHIDKTYRRAYNIEPNMCWECYSCVKACPQNAIDMRGYADFAPLGHSVRVQRDEKKGTIAWRIKFRNGTEKNFLSPITTKPWGQAIPKLADVPGPSKEMRDSQLLYNEPKWIRMDEGGLRTLEARRSQAEERRLLLMAYDTIIEDGIDVLVVGAGLGGSGAAWEARFWGQNKKIVIAEKANIDRSGAVAQGLYAINCYMGTRWGENNPEDHVRYARIDLMGLVREDLLFDMARHVDSTVHQFEEWGLPIMKDPKTGRYLREGRWQIMIHGESYKPIVAEAAKKSADKVFNRICVTHLLMDDSRENRVAGAVGFNVRTGNYHVFKSKTVICGAGGASNIFKPRSVGEGSGRTWYAPWSSASAYGLMIDAGAKMTQMENRIVLARFKDGYGPVGAYFLHLKTYTQNCLGEEYESKWFPDLQKMVGKEYLDPEASHLTHRPIPTCLRNHCIISEVNAGRGPIHMVTMRAFQDPHLEEVGWENFLGMTVGQAVLWAATDVDPKNENPELTTSEPYVMGSHATCSGAWCSGPEDVSPPEYFWGYNRMTTIEGPVRRRRRGRRHAARLLVGVVHRRPSRGEGRLQVHRRRQGRRHRRLRRADQPPQGGDLQAHGALPDLPQCDRGGRRQPALHQSQAGPGPSAEADGRVLRRRDRQLHDQREAPEHRPQEAQDHGGRPREPGRQGHPRAAARVGIEAPSPRCRVRHAAHAVPQGDALAGLLLPG